MSAIFWRSSVSPDAARRRSMQSSTSSSHHESSHSHLRLIDAQIGIDNISIRILSVGASQQTKVPCIRKGWILQSGKKYPIGIELQIVTLHDYFQRIFHMKTLIQSG